MKATNDPDKAAPRAFLDDLLVKFDQLCELHDAVIESG